jgi:hypothetical protein
MKDVEDVKDGEVIFNSGCPKLGLQRGWWISNRGSLWKARGDGWNGQLRRGNKASPLMRRGLKNWMQMSSGHVGQEERRYAPNVSDLLGPTDRCPHPQQ